MEGSENRLECALVDRAKYFSVETFLVRQISYEQQQQQQQQQEHLLFIVRPF